MSLFEDDRYRWRETYFVQFPAKNRPSLEKVRQALSTLGDSLHVTEGNATASGQFESITILAPDDFAAIDVSYLAGDEVLEQAQDLAKELAANGCEEDVAQRAKKLRRYDGRFDVLHFERTTDENEEEPEGMLNPSTLLLVLACLARLTGGVAVDPQAGTFI